MPGSSRDPLARGFPRAPEAFGFTANRGAYVPRPATEGALSQLIASLREARPVTALTGPPGLGKTLLLRLLSDRLDAELHAVFLAYGALPPEDFCAIVLDQLGSPRTDDPSSVLRAYARHLAEEGSALLLLIDDAGAIPSETVRWFCDLARSANGAIRCVFAVTDDSESGEVVAALGGEAAVVRLATPMTLAETQDYVEAQLAVGRVSGAVHALFDDAAVTRLHEVSGGVPRRLHTAAQALLRQQPPAASPAAALDEAASALDAPSEAAATRVAPAIQEEIERLRREVTGRGAAPAPQLAWSRRAVAMAAAFAAAVVVGLGMAVAYRPLSSWLASSERGPAAVARGPAPSGAPERALASGPPLREPAASVAAEPAPLATAAAPAPPAAAGGTPLAAGPGPTPPAPSAPAPLESAAPPPEPVSVNINASPWATVELDGAALGETPLAGVPVTPGPHRFRAHMPDGSVLERTVEIDAENRFVVFEMPPAAPAEGP